MINSATASGKGTVDLDGTLGACQSLSLILRGSGLWYAEHDGRIRIGPGEPRTRSGLRFIPTLTRSNLRVLKCCAGLRALFTVQMQWMN